MCFFLKLRQPLPPRDSSIASCSYYLQVLQNLPCPPLPQGAPSGFCSASPAGLQDAYHSHLRTASHPQALLPQVKPPCCPCTCHPILSLEYPLQSRDCSCWEEGVLKVTQHHPRCAPTLSHICFSEARPSILSAFST